MTFHQLIKLLSPEVPAEVALWALADCCLELNAACAEKDIEFNLQDTVDFLAFNPNDTIWNL